MNAAPAPADGWMPPERALAREARLARVAAGTMHDLNNRLGTALLGASSLEVRRNALERALGDGTLIRRDLADFFSRHREGQALVADSLRRAAEQANALRELALDQFSARPRVFELRQYLAGALHGLVLTRKPDATMIRVGGDQITFEHRPALWAAVAEDAAAAVLPSRGGSATVGLRHLDGRVEMDFTADLPRRGEEIPGPAQNVLASLGVFVAHCLRGSVTALPVSPSVGAGLRVTVPVPSALVVPEPAA